MGSSDIYTALFENSHSVKLLINPETGNIEDANAAACNYYGYAKDEITSMKITDINTLSEEEVFNEMCRAKDEQRNYFNFRHRLSDGKIRDVEVHTGPIDIKGKKLLYSIIHDVTEKKQTEDALRYSENFLKSIVDNEPECVKLLDSDGRLVTMNPSGLRMIEADSLEQVKGQKVQNIVAPEYRDAFKALVKKVTNGEKGKLEFRITGLKGTERWLETSAVPFEDETADRMLLLGVTRDITERKQAEEKIRKSESQSRKAQKIAGLGFWDLDLITGELYWSDEIYEMLGFKVGEIVPNYEIFKDRLHPDDRDNVQKHVDAALNDDIPYNIDFRYLLPAGDICYANAQGEVTRDEFGKATRIFGTQQDITGRKRIEGSLIRERSTAEYERAKSDAILASLGDGVSMQSRDFKVLFQNDAHKGMVGEHLGEFCFKAYEGKDAVCDGCPVEKTFDDGEVHTVIRSLEMDGDVRYFEITASSIKDPAGNISVGIEVVREITERKHMEEELRQALNDKDLLMREVHHRVKNNLAVIQSLLSLQMQDISDDKTKAYFVDARNRVKSMTIIHEMLHRSGDITRLSSLEFIRKLVKTLFSNYKTKTNHIKLQYDIDNIELDVDTMIPMGLIINELVSNALKYAFPDETKGKLDISMKARDDASYELVIKDSGVGLPEDFDMQKVTSLGLMIVNSLSGQINGALEVSGSDGAEFRIIFSEKAVP